MVHCVFIAGNKMTGGQDVDVASTTNHATPEMLKFGKFILLLIKLWATSGPKSIRNVGGTYLVNHHSKLYPNDDYRILNGPYKMIAINEVTGFVLNHSQLATLRQAIQDRMDADILAGRYSTDITVEEGVEIKKTL
jgi:hypothetical protein